MEVEWEEKALGELFDVKHGFAFKGKHFVEEPTDFLVTTPGNFTIGGGFQNNKPKYYNGPIPDGYILSPGDVIVTMTDLSKASDTLGNAALVPDDGNTWLHNQRIGLLEFPNREAADQKFTCYLLRSNEYRSWIVGSATGTTVKHTSPSRITEFSCALPPLPEQKAIAHVLGSLDGKIELNRRMNETLEGMAQALFKSWFVDFDPVIDNALAAGNPIPEPLVQRAETRRQALANRTANRETAQAFPASFRFTEELAWIPEGWEVLRFTDLSEAKQGRYLAKDQMSKVPDERFKYPVWGGNGILGYGLKKSYNEPITLMTCRGSNCGLIKFTRSEAWISNNSFACTTKFGSEYFLYSYFNFENFSDCISGSAQPQITFTALKNKIMQYPVSSDAVELFSDCTKTLLCKQFNNEKKSQTLAKLRDVLLPKLISGELRIPQAEKMVEEAIG